MSAHPGIDEQFFRGVDYSADFRQGDGAVGGFKQPVLPSDLHGSAVEYRCAVHGKGGIAVRQFAADHRVHGAGAELGFGHVDADCSVREVCGGCAGEEDRTAAVEDDVFNGLNAVKGAEVTGRCRTESQGVRSAVAGNPAVHFAAGDRESVIAVSAEDIADDLTAGDRELIIARPKADLAADQGIGAVDGDGIGALRRIEYCRK